VARDARRAQRTAPDPQAGTPPPSPPAPPPARALLSDRIAHARHHFELAAECKESGLLWEVEDQERWYDFGKPAGETLQIGNLGAEELGPAIAELSDRGHAFIDAVRDYLLADLHARLASYRYALSALRLCPEGGTVWQLIEDNGWGHDFGELAERWLPEAERAYLANREAERRRWLEDPPAPS
jgi:hypothetical protein